MASATTGVDHQEDEHGGDSTMATTPRPDNVKTGESACDHPYAMFDAERHDPGLSVMSKVTDPGSPGAIENSLEEKGAAQIVSEEELNARTATLSMEDKQVDKQSVPANSESLSDKHIKCLEKSVLEHASQAPQPVQIQSDMPLLYNERPYVTDSERRSTKMAYKYDNIEHTTHLRLFRMAYDEDPWAPVRGVLEVFPYEQLPECCFLANSAAFSRRRAAWIFVGNEQIAVPRGFEYFLRVLRESRGQKIEDVAIFALVLCLDADEPKYAMQKLSEARVLCCDVMNTVNGLPEHTLLALRQHSKSECQPLIRLPHARQLDGGFWAQRYSLLHMPLDRTMNEIRLLSLNLYNNQPFFHLWHTEIEEQNLYTALSYAWGDGTKTIQIQGQDVTVSHNLHDFLMTTTELARGIARDCGIECTRALIYWIDAVCINQNDEREKVSQIKRMHEIYSNAMHVIAWLGQGSHLGFFKAMQRNIQSMEVKPDEELFAREYRMDVPLWNDDIGLSIMNTFSRPYFTRAWTTQELVSAKEILVQCGQDMVPMDYLAILSPTRLDMAMFECLLQRQNAAIDDTIAFMRGFTVSRPGFVHRYKARRACKKPVTMLSLLLATLNMRSKVAKDKIYSLWSVADDASKLLKYIDYTQSDAELFAKLAAAWMHEYRRLDILAVRSVPTLDMMTSNCPTWAVDWHDYDRGSRPFLSSYPSGVRKDVLDEPEHNRLYDASKGVDFFLAATFVHPDSYSTVLSPALIVSGISCDSIAHLSEVHTDLRLRQDWLDFSDSSDLYAAFAAGRTPDGEKVEPHDPRKYWKLPEGFDPGKLHEAIKARAAYDPPGESTILEDPIAEEFFKGIAWRQHIQANTFGRRIAVTLGGHIGLVPGAAKIGDEIGIVFNCSIPLVLRRTPLYTKQLIGDAYFHRMMDGEMVEAAGGGTQCLVDLLQSVQEARSARELRNTSNAFEKATKPVSEPHNGGRAPQVETVETPREGDRETHSLCDADPILSTDIDSEDKSETSNNIAASAVTGGRDAITSAEIPPDIASASSEREVEYQKASDLWNEDLNAPMIDVINAATRSRQPTDRGVWVQLFHLPGSPDSPEFADYRKRYKEHKEMAKAKASERFNEQYAQSRSRSSLTHSEQQEKQKQQQQI